MFLWPEATNNICLPQTSSVARKLLCERQLRWWWILRSRPALFPWPTGLKGPGKVGGDDFHIFSTKELGSKNTELCSSMILCLVALTLHEAHSVGSVLLLLPTVYLRDLYETTDPWGWLKPSIFTLDLSLWQGESTIILNLFTTDHDHIKLHQNGPVCSSSLAKRKACNN